MKWTSTKLLDTFNSIYFIIMELKLNILTRCDGKNKKKMNKCFYYYYYYYLFIQLDVLRGQGLTESTVYMKHLTLRQEYTQAGHLVCLSVCLSIIIIIIIIIT